MKHERDREPMVLACDHLHQPSGWLSPGSIRIDPSGAISSVEPGAAAGATRVGGFVVPGVANVHSHAFQRALVGAAERAGGGDDSFWTWREEMYALAATIGPDALEAVAAQLYVEMLEAGMTAVGEFHYLHHPVDGARYARPGELSHRIVAAAARAGIGLTHLPVLYMRGGFDAAPSPRQRRFVHDGLETFWRTIDDVRLPDSSVGLYRLGVAPHSLRAVGADALREVVGELRRRDPEAPVHIHIAEQTAEVEQAIEHLGARPIAWLLDACEVDDGWCLIHATHADPRELAGIASAGAVVGVCPTTEANLGDGVFPTPAFARAGGRLAIGSDSHVSVDPAEELRLLEYAQRLVQRRRNVLCDPDAGERHVGRYLFDRAARWGGRAIAQPIGAIERGMRADLVVLDPDHPRLVGHGPDTVLDAWILGAARDARSPIREVWVAGERVVADGAHVRREPIAAAFRTAIAGLRAARGVRIADG